MLKLMDVANVAARCVERLGVKREEIPALKVNARTKAFGKIPYPPKLDYEHILEKMTNDEGNVGK